LADDQQEDILRCHMPKVQKMLPQHLRHWRRVLVWIVLGGEDTRGWCSMPHQGIDRLLYFRWCLVWVLEQATRTVVINAPAIPKQMRVANSPP
jgi:hypothetical protein